jgi:hypothetical protein
VELSKKSKHGLFSVDEEIAKDKIEQLRRDAAFLQRFSIMDYSLLVSLKGNYRKYSAPKTPYFLLKSEKALLSRNNVQTMLPEQERKVSFIRSLVNRQYQSVDSSKLSEDSLGHTELLQLGIIDYL